jgi:uncharacterized protein (TIGR02145 family)
MCRFRPVAGTCVLLALSVMFAGCGKKPGQESANNAAEPVAALTDARDGNKYKTVKIGNRTWMAQNLNYQPDSGNSWCYNDSASYCGKYGRLYDWKTAKKACPAGWKLPDTADWNKLTAASGGKESAGKKLKSKNGWNNRNDGSGGNGTDSHGFSALPGGAGNTDTQFVLAGENGYWWTSTEYNDGLACYRGIYCDLDDIYISENYINENKGDMDESYDYAESNRYSVRCVKE